MHFPNEIWDRPVPDTQLRLFGTPTKEGFAALRVTREDVCLWHKRGWISFDVDLVAELEDPHEKEIQFIRHLVVSGLSAAEINRFLEELPRPYAYDPRDMAYHFTYGWVTPNTDDPYDVVDKHVSDWLTELDSNRLKQLLDEIHQALEELDDYSDEDE